MMLFVLFFAFIICLKVRGVVQLLGHSLVFISLEKVKETS